jgi:hypothetical protein
MTSPYVVQAGLQLVGSRGPPTSASQASGIRGMLNHAQFYIMFKKRMGTLKIVVCYCHMFFM